MTYPPDSRFNDMSSYVTDTSSITNPVELEFSSSGEDESSATSALTGLTGWTSANGGVLAAVSELSQSDNFPVAHSKSNKSAYTESGEDDMEAVSEMLESNKFSAISFEMDGSVETSLGEIDDMPRIRSYKSENKKQAEVVNPARAVKYRTRSGSPRPIKSKGNKGNAYGGGVPAPAISPTSSVLSNNSNASKKRAPVPPLRDPNMDDAEEDQMWEEDCNYDINPTLMFLVLESREWKETIALLDGKGLENKNEAWNLGQLFGRGKSKDADSVETELAKKRKNELKVQARTWIVRRERNGVLRWRMLPLHAALAFDAPFDVVLRLYHLYPGAVRCRNDQGMLPLHHVFKYGNGDKVLELLLDVFPEALTVLDDRGRLPLACTPKDGSDNERRSNILTLFSNFQVDLALSMTRNDAESPAVHAGVPQRNSLPANVMASTAQQTNKPLPIIEPLSPNPMSHEGTGTLGAAPRYTANKDYNPVTLNAIKPPAVAAVAPSKKKADVEQAPAPITPLSPKEDSIGDRYAMFDCDDSENNPSIGNGRLALSTIPEELPSPKHDQSALKLELLALGEKKKKKGLRKLFGVRRG